MGSKMAKIVLGIVFLAVFNVLFFIIKGTENASYVWISYGFIQVAYFFLLITPLFNRGNKGLTVLSMDLYSLSFSYFLVELIVGLVFMNVQQTDNTWALLVQVILFALYLLPFLSNFIANKSTQQSMETSDLESIFVKESAAQLGMLMRQVSDKNAGRKLEMCYDLMRTSPIESHARVRDVEKAIGDAIQTLKTAVEYGEQDKIEALCRELRLRIEERNNTLKYIKN